MTLVGYEQIHYIDHPHFTVGHVDQWGENGYLFYDGKVYSYEEDRKCQYGRTHSPMTINEFLAFASSAAIKVPDFFLEILK